MRVGREFKRIFHDILRGRNLEAYVVAAIGIALIAIDVIGEVEIGLYLSVMTAALVVLVYRSTRPDAPPIDLDSVLKDRQSFGTVRDFVKGARAVWLYGPSAANALSETPTFKRELLERGGELRVLLQDPQVAASMAILQRQLDTVSDLRHDIAGALHRLRQLRGNGRFEYRLLPYSPGFSLFIVDPHGTDGRLVVEFFGFHNEQITDRMHITIHRRETLHWFDYWVKQYEKMWAAARPEQEPEPVING